MYLFDRNSDKEYFDCFSGEQSYLLKNSFGDTLLFQINKMNIFEFWARFQANKLITLLQNSHNNLES